MRGDVGKLELFDGFHTVKLDELSRRLVPEFRRVNMKRGPHALWAHTSFKAKLHTAVHQGGLSLDTQFGKPQWSDALLICCRWHVAILRDTVIQINAI